LTIIISAIKIIFLLGFLILIHEAGHLLVAKWCKVKVNEFSMLEDQKYIFDEIMGSDHCPVGINIEI